MRGALILAAALLLTGCDQSEAVDGYVFTAKEWDRSEVVMRKVEHKSFAELRAALPARMNREWKDLHVARGAWGELHADGSCTMHIIDPTVRYQPEWIGHEAAHCFYGPWHK